MSRWRARVRRLKGSHRWVIAVPAVATVLLGVVVVVARGSSQPTEVVLPRAQHVTPAPVAVPPSARSAVTSSTVAAAPDLVVHVAGAVRHPGLVRLAAGARVDDALRAAGGPTPDADLDRVNLAQPLADGVRVLIAARGDPDSTPAGVSPPAGSNPPGTGGGSAGDDDAPVDLNAASPADLERLPGVGPATAAAIVEYRDAHGPFRSVDDLEQVRGIGPAKLEALRPHARV
jgi:competence protein ComEA